MPIIAAVVLLACIVLTLLILRGRVPRSEREYERDPEVEEALERMREWARRPAVVITGAVIVGLGLIAALARNPSRWAVMLVALAVLFVAVTGYLVAQRRRREQ